LLGYHSILIYKNLTTKEEMRISPLKKTTNTYLRKGFWKHFKDVIFPKISKISLLEKLKKRYFELEKVKYFLKYLK